MKRTNLILLLLLFVKTSFSQVSDVTLSAAINADGLCLDSDTLYVAEGWSGTHLFKILPGGKVTTFMDNLDGPIDVVRRANGNFYVSEWKAGRIAEITPFGSVTSYISVSPGPGPMTLDKDQNIYVTHNINNGSGSITRIDTAGIAHPFFSGPPLNNPGGITCDESGKLYVANFNNGNIIRIKPSGQHSILAKIPVSGTWKTAHAKYHSGRIYINSLSAHKVFTVDTFGQVSVFAGTGVGGHLGGHRFEAQFLNPDGLCISTDGKILYVARGIESTSYLQKIEVSNINNIEENTSFTPALQIIPNPANEQVTLKLQLSHGAKFKLQIYTVEGQLMSTIHTQEREAGTYLIKLDCQSWYNGWYMAVLTVDGVVLKKSFLVQKRG